MVNFAERSVGLNSKSASGIDQHESGNYAHFMRSRPHTPVISGRSLGCPAAVAPGSLALATLAPVLILGRPLQPFPLVLSHRGQNYM
ncbi:uncharacterized protein VTP21DRAFT_6567 [Calcarisporiella thermophila]|uniref:uncharacterized protein n=1 Tax=Calcarisporiella thermophila TaxID=911321 RepID=UPI003744B072